ncbi:Ferrous iron transporter B [Pseudomonas sp. OF001]|uniref:ferrous iron transporter B n=1 Tax=unclassified Pseudomonas TaxID=196821 RepID=UPI0010A6A845|nr:MULTISPECIES: ferrous iron transporter B [unclassified Pseudomonas]THG84538.1 ferrous iron transporter B [Pseudomonas sp. A-1]WPP47280.1 ferrous iron transporter B [Pseudomonas sp. AN-1]CAD5377565.1 Ferrous iron transporter B [Pseudomonas sp. OF001]
MVTGATSLGLVRNELFATIEQAEQSLEQFIADRLNVSLLQQAVEYLQQIRGILKLIELAGAELLAQEALLLATDIPVGAGQERDGQLAALGKALFVLRRYLEGIDNHRQEIPELLLPIINEVRLSTGQPALPECYFFSVRLDQPRPPRRNIEIQPGVANRDGGRLRQMYQLGLMNVLREQNLAAALKLMSRALGRLDDLLGGRERSRLCWIGAAALEAMADGRMRPTRSRKQLLSRLDRDLRQLLGNQQFEAPRSLLKELLYMVALAGTQGERASEMRRVFGLAPLPFTDHLLEEESRRLSGPGEEVMRSLSLAIREELAGVKDALDLIERGAAQQEARVGLHAQVGKLAKTLGMVGLSSAANALQAQVEMVGSWCSRSDTPPAAELLRLADALLYMESMVATLEQSEQRKRQASTVQIAGATQGDSYASHQLVEARIVVIDEAQAGLALAKRAITAYLESSGDKLNLANVPTSLQAVRGGLWFLGLERAAELVGACADYIQRHMIENAQIPSEQMLETLADALTSLEFFLEGGANLRPEGQQDVLDLAADSVRALGMQVAA